MVLVLAVLVVPAVRAQQGTGVTSGRVVDGVSGKPVSAAIVTIAGAGMTVMSGGTADRPRVLTGADGRFVFRDLPLPGTFTVSANKSGYADGASGRRRP